METVNFWQDDPVWRAAHDRRKVGQRRIIQGVDPDPYLVGAAIRGPRVEERANHLPSRSTIGGGDGILEVQDRGVGAEVIRLGQFSLTVTWNEQPRSKVNMPRPFKRQFRCSSAFGFPGGQPDFREDCFRVLAMKRWGEARCAVDPIQGEGLRHRLRRADRVMHVVEDDSGCRNLGMLEKLLDPDRSASKELQPERACRYNAATDCWATTD